MQIELQKVTKTLLILVLIASIMISGCIQSKGESTSPHSEIDLRLSGLFIDFTKSGQFRYNGTEYNIDTIILTGQGFSQTNTYRGQDSITYNIPSGGDWKRHQFGTYALTYQNTTHNTSISYRITLIDRGPLLEEKVKISRVGISES